jgi:hypothetical protein
LGCSIKAYGAVGRDANEGLCVTTMVERVRTVQDSRVAGTFGYPFPVPIDAERSGDNRVTFQGMPVSDVVFCNAGELVLLFIRLGEVPLAATCAAIGISVEAGAAFWSLLVEVSDVTGTILGS